MSGETKITQTDVRGIRPRGRPHTGWMKNAKRALHARGMLVEQGVTVHGRHKGRAVVNV